ncbi:phosphatidate cytidylyltransferase [Pseudohongiella spirulinae]|uniref:Phosphatidate cytidylyltransferase n=1 Tax=Pseudohongiella spirulinae TaxID=1249552 RepID=A0A0S2KCK9_9GAMM|nr:phosphatidate cytidylyltransferase [Pseudohongiella spirulinae]ALO46042.1 Phosphatidate cytidylyltransferase [Pseudohongiella spirulinae]
MLRQRVLTAVGLLLVLYAGTAWLPLPYFGGFLSLILLPALWEWGRLMGLNGLRQQAAWMLSFTFLLSALLWILYQAPEPPDKRLIGAIMLLAAMFWLWVFMMIRQFPAGGEHWQAQWKMAAMGLMCLLPAWVGLYYLKSVADSGILVLMLVALVSVVDIGAFFTGRAWGNKKLAPVLSPKKSWAGFWGGLGSCLAASVVLLFLVQRQYPLSIELWILLLCFSVLLAAMSVVGDLFESMLKRHRGVKDSGRSLPGHGGVLDRIDSLLAATPVFVLALIVLQSMPGVV